MTVGSLGTIIFGVWLAISLDGVAVWSGWVIAAIILWAVGTETGRRGGTYFAACHRPREGARCFRADTAPTRSSPSSARTQHGLMLHSISSLAILLILVDMIWKPGA